MPPARSPPRRIYVIPPLVLSPQHECNYIKKGFGVTMRDSLNVMGLNTGVTVSGFSVRYRYLARQLYSDKQDLLVTGMTSEEAVQLLKLINNTPGPTSYNS